MQFWISCKIFIIHYWSLKQVRNLTCIAAQACALDLTLVGVVNFYIAMMDKNDNE